MNEALLSEAETDLERQQSLFASSDVSQKAVDEAETAVRRLKAEVETERLSIEADEANLAVLDALIDAAEAEIERAEEELSYTVIRSPIDGIVTKVNAEVGEIVVTGTMNNAGTVVMEVADFSTMICTAEVDEASIAQVSVGQRATVRSPAYDDLRLGGVVRSVSLAKTASIGDGAGSDYYEVEVLLDEDGTGDFRKFSGLTADVEVETERYDGVLRVPSQAGARTPGRRASRRPARAAVGAGEQGDDAGGLPRNRRQGGRDAGRDRRERFAQHAGERRAWSRASRSSSGRSRCSKP